MLLTHSRDTWPEAMGSKVQCGCGLVLPACDCLSIAWSRTKPDGSTEVPMQLVCVSCVLVKSEPQGRC